MKVQVNPTFGDAYRFLVEGEHYLPGAEFTMSKKAWGKYENWVLNGKQVLLATSDDDYAVNEADKAETDSEEVVTNGPSED